MKIVFWPPFADAAVKTRLCSLSEKNFPRPMPGSSYPLHAVREPCEVVHVNLLLVLVP